MDNTQLITQQEADNVSSQMFNNDSVEAFSRKTRSYSKTLESMSSYKGTSSPHKNSEKSSVNGKDQKDGGDQESASNSKPDNSTVAAPMASSKNTNGEDTNILYYPEYCRLYFANILLTTKLKNLMNDKDTLLKKLKILESNKKRHEENIGWSFEISDEKSKRHRRTALEINRHYKCIAKGCPKSYGSEGSLNQHVKLKHNELYYATLQKEHHSSSSNRKNGGSKSNGTESLIDEALNAEKDYENMLEDDLKGHNDYVDELNLDANLLVDNLFRPDGVGQKEVEEDGSSLI